MRRGQLMQGTGTQTSLSPHLLPKRSEKSHHTKSKMPTDALACMSFVIVNTGGLPQEVRGWGTKEGDVSLYNPLLHLLNFQLHSCLIYSRN